MHIFVLVGRSGSGKTSIQKRSRLNIPQSITTRKQREGEVDYLFLSNPQFYDMLEDGNIVFPNCVYGNTWYGIQKDTLDDKISCVVLDAIGLRQAQERYGFNNVTGIMVEAPPAVIFSRMKARGSTLVEIKERIDKDGEKFKGIYNLCEYKITNDRDIEDAIIEILDIIKEVLVQKGEKM